MNIWEPSVKAGNKFMNWCVYSALRDCQNLHRDRLSDWLAIGYTATTTTTTTSTTATATATPTTTTTTTTTTTITTPATTTTTVSFPDRFRTAQAYFAPKFEIECVHAWILTLITRLATTLSTTTTPTATAPPLPLVHLGISAFAFKSNWHESRWRVRSQSETSQKPVRNRPNATICSPPSLPLSLSFSLSLPLPFFPCPATRTPTPIPTIFYVYDLINEEQTLPRLLTVVPRLLRDWLSDWGLSGKRYFGQPPYVQRGTCSLLCLRPSQTSSSVWFAPMTHIPLAGVYSCLSTCWPICSQSFLCFL